MQTSKEQWKIAYNAQQTIEFLKANGRPLASLLRYNTHHARVDLGRWPEVGLGHFHLRLTLG